MLSPLLVRLCSLFLLLGTCFAQAPVADFDATPTTGVAPLSVAFADLSTGALLAWSWDFGDGTHSTEPAPAHVFAAPGRYTVALTVSGPEGAHSKSRSEFIVVLPQAPVAAFAVDGTSGPAPFTARFSDTSTGTIESWSWAFGDGTVSSDAAPSHVYEAPGTYSITLTVSGPGGSDSVTHEALVQVTDVAPVAEFDASPTEGVAPLLVSFNDLSTGVVEHWTWSFGDGESSTEAEPAHTYDAPGDYEVRLTVAGPGGTNSRTRSGFVQVTEAAPAVSFTASPTAGTGPLSVTFNPVIQGTITGWSWDFGDGTLSTEPAPVHVYTQAGEYSVRLTVTGPGGSDSVLVANAIRIAAPAPVAVAAWTPDAGAAPLSIHFEDRSTGEVTSRVWDFGDGQSSHEAAPVHVYERSGTFEVTLSVTGSGGSDTTTGTLAVQPAPLVAALGATPTSGKPPLRVQFSDLSSGEPGAWVWSFGDGSSSTEQHPVHVFEAPGEYDVTLAITGPGGTTNAVRTGMISVIAPQPPVADFAATVRVGDAPLVVEFADHSTGDVDTYTWDFGDGQTSNLAAPSHTYTQPGAYSVQLSVTGPAGTNTRGQARFVTVVPPTQQPAGPLGVGVRSRPAIGFTPGIVDFGAERIGTLSQPRTVTLTNLATQALTLNQIFLQGLQATEFQLAFPGGTVLPVTLAPNATLDVELSFQPMQLGEAGALLRVPTPGVASPPSFLRVTGVALGALGDDLRVDCLGLSPYVDTQGDTWAPDFGDLGGGWANTVEAIAGTLDDPLYQHQRRGTHFAYRLPVLESGVHEVRFHFAEINGLPEGARRFDVSCEGVIAIADLDVTSKAGGVATALVVSRPVNVQDGMLDIEFNATVGEACIAAIEIIGVPYLDASSEGHSFGSIAANDSASFTFSLVNRGVRTATPSMLSWALGGSGTAESFAALWNGTSFPGTSGQIDHPFSPGGIAPGQSLALDVVFAPTTQRFDVATLSVTGDFAPVELELSGLGGHEGDPYLHVVILAPDVVLDYDGNGSESVVVDGTGSHTHEPGRSLIGYWLSLDGALVSTAPLASVPMALGLHTVQLEIVDDGTPVRTLVDDVVVDVRSLDRAPGVLLRYYDASASSASAMIDALPSHADFAEFSEFAAIYGPTQVGGSPFTQDVVVELRGGFQVPTAGTFAIVPQGGVAQRLFVDGNPVSSALQLQAGVHTLQARWAVDTLSNLPLAVSMVELGVGPFDPSPLFHDLGSVPPVVSSMTATGSTAGNNLVVIEGIGFFPTANLVVHWGGTDLFAADFEYVDASTIRLRTPPMPAGTISVTVDTPRGTSNARSFTYDQNGPVPIQFQEVLSLGVPNPTAGAFGPDGRFYTVALDGRLTAIQFDANYVPLAVTTYPGVSGLTNSDATGIAFDPYGDAQPVRVYVSHGHHYQNGGGAFTGASAYTGQISVLVGPTFDTPLPLVTGLPVSNHDHSVNGFVFDDAGDLLIPVGSMTNAGVRHPNSGDLPESPLAGAIIRARISDPGFQGAVSYHETATGLTNADQVDGHLVDLAPGGLIDVWASGVRHCFDLVLTTRGRLYGTDNGPNVGFGAASTGANSEDPDPYDDDELLLLERGLYYGHPNRNRGRTDPRQNVYRPGSVGESIPHVFRQRTGWLPPSSNGIDEYRSDVFGGAMRGDLLVQKWMSNVRRVQLTPDGRALLSLTPLDPWAGGLGLVTGPGGAILSLDYTNGRLRVLKPVQPAGTGVEIADITPWRAPATGGGRFVLAGRGFGTIGNTTVSIGGQQAPLISVAPTRIVGTFPARAAVDEGLVDVVVSVGGVSDVHENAVRPLLGRGSVLERWEQVLPEVPVAIGEVAAAEIAGILYLVGEGTSATLRFDMERRQWLAPAAQRLYVGDHHAAEVLDGKLYLVGGFQGGAEGRLQIYDPGTDSWTEGAPMTWAGGSVSTAVIDGILYAAGGIVNTWTVDNAAMYDPTTDSWTSISGMPQGRNHAAFGTDGQRLWVFGGRVGGNFVQNGYANVQVYDPMTNTWDDSDDPASTLEPLPYGRGGMGHAVWFEGEFFVFGGETQTGAGAEPVSNVYRRVDVLAPATGTWREATPIPTARHGIDPFLYDRWIFLAGGGVRAGYSNSRVFEGIYLP